MIPYRLPIIPAITYSYKAIPSSHHTIFLYYSSPHNTPKHYTRYELFILLSLYCFHPSTTPAPSPAHHRTGRHTTSPKSLLSPRPILIQAFRLPRALLIPQPRAPSHPAARPRVYPASSHPTRSQRRPAARVICRSAASAFRRILGRLELSRRRTPQPPTPSIHPPAPAASVVAASAIPSRCRRNRPPITPSLPSDIQENRRAPTFGIAFGVVTRLTTSCVYAWGK